MGQRTVEDDAQLKRKLLRQHLHELRLPLHAHRRAILKLRRSRLRVRRHVERLRLRVPEQDPLALRPSDVPGVVEQGRRHPLGPEAARHHPPRAFDRVPDGGTPFPRHPPLEDRRRVPAPHPEGLEHRGRHAREVLQAGRHEGERHAHLHHAETLLAGDPQLAAQHQRPAGSESGLSTISEKKRP